MRNLKNEIEDLKELPNYELIEEKLLQLIQLIKEDASDKGKSQASWEYNIGKLNIKVSYDRSNLFKGVF